MLAAAPPRMRRSWLAKALCTDRKGQTQSGYNEGKIREAETKDQMRHRIWMARFSPFMQFLLHDIPHALHPEPGDCRMEGPSKSALL